MAVWPVVIESQDATSVSARVPVRLAASWFEGHFPSQPVLPGVAMLSLVEETLRTHLLPLADPGTLLRHLRRVRFRSIVSPEAQTLRVCIKASATVPRAYDFEVESDGVLICTGSCVVA